MAAVPLVTPGSAEEPAVRDRTEALSLLAHRVRPARLAREDLLVLKPALADLIGAPGLRRGSVVVVEAAPAAGASSKAVPSGATSVALGLFAGPVSAGAYGAVVGLPDLGLLAAKELGVALDHLVLVPAPDHKAPAVVAALLEAFDLVLVRFPVAPAPAIARRLIARARERRSVLVLAGPGTGTGVWSGAPSLSWPEPPEVRLVARCCAYEGIRQGSGHLLRRRVEVVARRRRVVPAVITRTLVFEGAEIALAPLAGAQCRR